ncbi:MAG: phosphonate metabolism protein/1,5-bisphosphokinase (PRPP-forming) PhnN [Burkholderiaceae bacterium]|nr:phosphonate metabolism protein/1,5-bisphosphokinase (PRPP-forming) PhnN [Burkholderiaceae bacterium]
MNSSQPGCFFLVVGPSGAGKDSLMDGAKNILPKDQYRFAKRTVTRPPGMVGEDYQSCDPATFAQRKARGEFLATWQAHGYEYGLPKELATEQAQGRHIVANGSRAVVANIASAVKNLVVVHVTAPIELLAKRLAQRGRETETEIKERLSRQITTFPDGIEVRTVVNDATLAQGIDRFVDAIRVGTRSKD